MNQDCGDYPAIMGLLLRMPPLSPCLVEEATKDVAVLHRSAFHPFKVVIPTHAILASLQQGVSVPEGRL